MQNIKIEHKVVNATKWSGIAEIIAKLISPITNMILARLLSPEAFGVIATVTMITSFVDMFTDAGFQKYLIQYEFKNKKEQFKYTNVAFLTNLVLSIFLWMIIIIFNEQIATIVGNPGLGHVIAIACTQLPITAFSSIQTALFKRNFDFKTLFFSRMAGIIIPFLVTIPLAIIGLSYWALIIGSILIQTANAVILTSRSEWKPSLYFNLSYLKGMLSFSIWTLIESISIWLTSWVDIFIISSYLNEYYLGLYRTSITMVNSLMGVIIATIIPVLFSTLSRLQNNELAFKKMFYISQKVVAYLVFPLGMGLFLFSDLATTIMLGEQWTEASNIIGIWSLTTVFLIVTSYFNSEVYRAKGKPKISFVSQMIHLVFLVPTCIISVKYGFWYLVYFRAFIRIQGVLTGFIFMKLIMNFSAIQTLKNLVRPLIFSVIMGVFAFLIKQISTSLIWNLMAVIASGIFYIILIILFGKTDIIYLKKILRRGR